MSVKRKYLPKTISIPTREEIENRELSDVEIDLDDPANAEIRKTIFNLRDLVELDGNLTPKMLAFCRELPVDGNKTQAAIRAGYSEKSAANMGSVLSREPKIKAQIQRNMQIAADAAQVSAELVLAEIYAVATSDSRDLISVYQDCCRFCYSAINGERQWTRGEYSEALEATQKAGTPAPPIRGGLTYNAKLPPVESCAECFGRGLTTVVVKDSRKISRAASKLLAGMKSTKDGVEIKTHDKMAALLALAKITGLLRDRTEITGAGGGPIALTAAPNFNAMTDDELRAALARSGHPVPPLIEGQITGGNTNEN